MTRLATALLIGSLLALPGCSVVRTGVDAVGAVGGAVGSVARGFAGRGGLCGDRRLAGEKVGRVPGKLPACGIDNAVRVTSVDGIALSQSALVDCTTARTFADWVQDTMVPAVGRRGGGVSEIRVAASYACRTRNHQPGAKVSEHGKGRAIDVSAVTLANGDVINVLDGWRGSRRDRRALRRMHEGACGPFGTVLGPESDRFHQDHFHFDTASYRSGSYCR